MIKDRQQLYNAIIPNKTIIKLTGGKNKGRKGLLIRKSNLKNYSYYYKNIDYTYNNYFDLTILSRGKKIYTSCNNIEIV